MVMSHTHTPRMRNTTKRERERNSEWMTGTHVYTVPFSTSMRTHRFLINSILAFVQGKLLLTDCVVSVCMKPDQWLNKARITYSKDFQSFFQFTLNLHRIDPCLVPTIFQVTGQMKGHFFCSFLVIILQTFTDFNNRRHSTVAGFDFIL